VKINPAANLPFLLDGEKLITENGAIIVYLCHKTKRVDLLGENCDDQVQIATVLGVFQDLYKSYLSFIYGARAYEEFK
jgi:glutathione S-transferase